jgi:hypothetical protein
VVNKISGAAKVGRKVNRAERTDVKENKKPDRFHGQALKQDNKEEVKQAFRKLLL